MGTTSLNSDANDRYQQGWKSHLQLIRESGDHDAPEMWHRDLRMIAQPINRWDII